jgi:ubiquinone/menaquinone biosynthesis C-methylase UbiE
MAMNEENVERWLDATGPRVLRNMGVASGQVILDLGCRHGRYAVVAAEVVGPDGYVYGVDRDPTALRDAKRLARSCGVSNLEWIALDFREKALPFVLGTIDVALLFDVTHAVFFPTPEQRRDLFAEVHRVLSPLGRMLIYPTHVRQHGPPLALLHAEVEASGFAEASRRRRHLLHDDRPVRGWVIDYRPGGQPGEGKR